VTPKRPDAVLWMGNEALCLGTLLFSHFVVVHSELIHQTFPLPGSWFCRGHFLLDFLFFVLREVLGLYKNLKPINPNIKWPLQQQYSSGKCISRQIIFNVYRIQHIHLFKSFPATGLAGRWRSGRLRLPDFLDFRHYEGGKVVTLLHRPPLPQGRFLVLISEAESTPGHMVPSVASEKIPSDTIGDRSRDSPTSSAVP
jgi:hypothetical protein